ncbi:MAG: hypothetical protein AWT59_3385 [Candidatus Gallionella acididurans]|uniref:Uncharacterized protein n=1 Tax=Candidatus Gallionella acididurans TaxID=1796491 RepID=A0A139BNE3_9PROT|nr:MAG: hypothetical protein AWT59_3385 [Candidatus Gallionella acididurans]
MLIFLFGWMLAAIPRNQSESGYYEKQSQQCADLIGWHFSHHPFLK